VSPKHGWHWPREEQVANAYEDAFAIFPGDPTRPRRVKAAWAPLLPPFDQLRRPAASGVQQHRRREVEEMMAEKKSPLTAARPRSRPRSTRPRTRATSATAVDERPREDYTLQGSVPPQRTSFED
jgi:hypothetical protein